MGVAGIRSWLQPESPAARLRLDHVTISKPASPLETCALFGTSMTFPVAISACIIIITVGTQDRLVLVIVP